MLGDDLVTALKIEFDATVSRGSGFDDMPDDLPWEGSVFVIKPKESGKK
jgi:hypothetical protein